MRSWERKGKNITNAIAPDACIGAHCACTFACTYTCTG